MEANILGNLVTLFVKSGGLAELMKAYQNLNSDANPAGLKSTSSSDESIMDSSASKEEINRPDDAKNDGITSSDSENVLKSDSSNSSSTSSSSTDSESSSSASSSKLEELFKTYQSWLENAGKTKTAKEQYEYLKSLLESEMNSLTSEEQEKAKEIIATIDKALTQSEQESKSTSTTTNESSSSTTPSAKTKTSDSYVSPELLSLVLSGSLAGLGISLKKRYE